MLKSLHRLSLTAALGALAITAALPLTAAPAQAQQELRRSVGPAPDTLDPSKAETIPAARVLYDLFEGLFTLDVNGNARPAMAESHEVSADGLVYTFTLRDAKWSDGSPVTAEDFVFAWRRLADPKTAAPYAYYVWPIVNGEAVTNGKMPPDALGVEAVDARTLKVTLHEPAGYFLATLQHPAMSPLHRASVEKFGDDFVAPQNMVTNGAYVLRENVPQTYIRLEKSPTYYDADQVAIPRVTDFVIENHDTEFKQYRAGELDITSTLPTTQVNTAKNSFPDAYKATQTYSTYYFAFNLNNEPWKSNAKLREALSLAIDRDVIAEKIIGGDEKPAYSFTPPGDVGGYTPPMPAFRAMTQAERDARAKELLAEAGYPGGKGLGEIEVIYSTSENNRKVMIAVSAMWKQKLGVQARLNNQEFRVVASIGNEKSYKDILFYAWIGDYPDPYTFLQLLRSDVAQQNLPAYKNPAYDAALNKANALTDPEARLAMMAEAEALALADHPIMTVFHNTRRRLVNPKIKGWEGNALDLHPSRYISFGE